MHKLVRYQNLIFIAVIQLLMSQAIIVPTLHWYSIDPLTPWWIIAFTVLGTLCITAGGYVINDYFDVKIDRINRPDKVLVGVIIEKQAAMRLYQVLTFIGVAIGIGIAFWAHSTTIGLIFIIVPGMLWFYSASYKRQFLIGNVIVAMSAALVPLLPLIIEGELLTAHYGATILQTSIINTLRNWICGFAFFAFMLTLIREIIKDMQDEYGDREMECRTLPIICGPTVSRVIVTLLALISNVILAWLVFTKIDLFGHPSIVIRYYLVGIAAPSICLLVILWNNSCTALRNASLLCKFIMLVGVLFSLVYLFVISQTL